MLEIIHDRTGDEETCHYLPDQRARMRYRIIESCRAETYARLLERGWRRFGRVFFRPVCAACRECRSLRLETDRFAPDRSMRRNLRRNRDLRVVLRPASMTRHHLALYNRYHADMAVRRDWREKAIAPLDYYRNFVEGRQDFGHELLYLEHNRLLGVALIDILPSAVSAVYCYYEPTERHRGIGVFSILRHVELARSRGIPHVYLGYWIESHPSMLYKARYRPNEILRGRPELDETPAWATAGVDREVDSARP